MFFPTFFSNFLKSLVIVGIFQQNSQIPSFKIQELEVCRVPVPCGNPIAIVSFKKKNCSTTTPCFAIGTPKTSRFRLVAGTNKSRLLGQVLVALKLLLLDKFLYRYFAHITLE